MQSVKVGDSPFFPILFNDTIDFQLSKKLLTTIVLKNNSRKAINDDIKMIDFRYVIFQTIIIDIFIEIVWMFVISIVFIIISITFDKNFENDLTEIRTRDCLINLLNKAKSKVLVTKG